MAVNRRLLRPRYADLRLDLFRPLVSDEIFSYWADLSVIGLAEGVTAV
jgi:hypothetical protein